MHPVTQPALGKKEKMFRYHQILCSILSVNSATKKKKLAAIRSPGQARAMGQNKEYRCLIFRIHRLALIGGVLAPRRLHASGTDKGIIRPLIWVLI